MESKEIKSQKELEKLMDQAMEAMSSAKKGEDILLLAKMLLKETQ